jgi:3-hydroxyisobutyrate dehydrogenase-like beta-hydroxyacid dehydrogenase
MTGAARPAGAVAMIGLGIMGSAMSRNLIAAGFTVHGVDPAPAAQAEFRAMGGQLAASVAEAAGPCEILLTCLPSAAALHQVTGELAAVPRGDRVLAETSTLALADKERAQRDRRHRRHHARLPVSGSGSQRRRAMCWSGSGPVDAWERCLPAFHAFSRGPHHLGDFGNGSKMKYVANLLVAIHTVAAGEAFALARKAGLDPAQMFAVVADGAGGSRALQVRGDMLIADRYQPVETMPLDLWRKDLKVIAEFAADLGCPTPMPAAGSAPFQAACVRLRAQDTAAVALVSEAGGPETRMKQSAKNRRSI